MDNLSILQKEDLRKVVRHWQLSRWHNDPVVKEAVLDFVEYVEKWKKIYLLKQEENE